ncbi:MAG: hypothetical protein EOM72_07895 [Opitutae bacterium]|nr:hypothetical protein [Opitutae bacterium]
MKSANPYQSLVAHGAAGLLAASTWLMTLPLKETPLHGLWSVVNDRGPFPCAALFFFYLNALAIIRLRKSAAPARALTQAAALFCAGPLLLGLGGTLLGYHLLATDVCELIDQATSGGGGLIAWHSTADSIRAGIRAAWDPAMFGALLSAANYLGLWMQKRIGKNDHPSAAAPRALSRGDGFSALRALFGVRRSRRNRDGGRME